jgi:VCBS repeat-containing protein
MSLDVAVNEKASANVEGPSAETPSAKHVPSANTAASIGQSQNASALQAMAARSESPLAAELGESIKSADADSEGVEFASLAIDADFAEKMAQTVDKEKEEEEEEDRAAAGGVAGSGVDPLYIVGGLGVLAGGVAIASGGGNSDTPPPPPPPANQAPTFSGATTFEGTEDTANAVQVSASDPDGDALTFSAGSAANGAVTGGAGGQFTYTPNANFNGSDSFDVTVSDGKGGQATTTVTVTVAPVNDAPVITSDPSFSGTEDVALAITVAATDVEGDTLAFAAGDAANGTVTGGSGGQFTYTPDADFFGQDTFVVTVSDGNGGVATQTVTVNLASDPTETVVIDIGNSTTPISLDAAGTGFTLGDAFTYTDNSGLETNVVISNFESDDLIIVSGDAANYNFSAIGDDLEITFNNTAAGALNVILLKDVGASAGFIADEATAEAVLGFDFFRAQTGSGGSGGDGVAVANGNLDDDDDNNTSTFAVTDAAGGDIAFTEDAGIANAVLINNFTAGDTIAVSNASLGAYSFTATGDDVIITYLNGATLNEIVLKNVAAGATTVIDSVDDVEALLGAGGVGFFKLAGTDPTTTTETIDVGVLGTAVIKDASTGAIKFTDDVAKATEVIIQGFGQDDRIQSNAASADTFSFTTADNDRDLVITFNNTEAGVSNSIVLDDIFVGIEVGFIADYNTAQGAVGFDFLLIG